MHSLGRSGKCKCNGGLYSVEDASVHLDGVQPQVLICDGLGACVPFWRDSGAGKSILESGTVVKAVGVIGILASGECTDTQKCILQDVTQAKLSPRLCSDDTDRIQVSSRLARTPVPVKKSSTCRCQI